MGIKWLPNKSTHKNLRNSISGTSSIVITYFIKASGTVVSVSKAVGSGERETNGMFISNGALTRWWICRRQCHKPQTHISVYLSQKRPGRATRHLVCSGIG